MVGLDQKWNTGNGGDDEFAPSRTDYHLILTGDVSILNQYAMCGFLDCESRSEFVRAVPLKSLSCA